MEFQYAVSTSLGVEEVVRAVTEGLSGVGFGVLWALDVQAKLQEKGLDLERPVRILEVCQPAKAKEALEDDVRISYFLPCKVVVYQEGEGTIAGFVRPEMFAGFFPGSKVFPGLAREVDAVLRGVLDRLPG
ncbi:MAG: DUF302 domain-containing protein [Peptococcaceae bacterium]|jgi:uncharacterized protein (DUF302 family)|nr:DUF302 domain-containing protein [Peptococcaceae bacterium]